MLHSLLLASLAAVRLGEAVAFPDHGLTITLPDLESAKRNQSPLKSCEGDWTGVWKGSDLHIRFHVLPTDEYDFIEPEDVVETWRDALRDPEKQDGESKPFTYSFGAVRSLPGLVGCTPILALLQASVAEKDDPSAQGLLLIAGGLLMEKGWSLRVEAWPAPDAAGTAELVAWLEKCVAYDGKLREAKWTDEEALAFWKRFAPESAIKKFEKPVRTKHFIFLTSSTSPGLYTKLIESKYDAFRKLVPFEELEGRRLLPVLLFRTADDFEAFYRRKYKLEPKDDIKVGGIAFGPLYATSCDRGDEFSHSIDVAKQLLINRLHVWGSCYWLTSGLREFVSSKPKERMDGLRAVKKGKHTPLAKLIDDDTWGDQSSKLQQKGASDEADYWEQSGMWMEFLREGPWPKENFMRLIRTVGSVPDDDDQGIAKAIESVYGTDLMTLEKKWVEYFKKR